MLSEIYTPKLALQFTSSHGHLMNYPSTHTRHQWSLYSLEQREGLNEIINIHSMAPTHAPGRTDPSQDLPSQAGRGSEGNGSMRTFGRGGQYTAQVTQEMPWRTWGPGDCLGEASSALNINKKGKKDGALAELD